MRKPNTMCTQCNKPIYKRPAELESGKRFCSTKCMGLSFRVPEKERPCVSCNENFYGSLNRKYCSRKCANIGRIDIKYDGSRTHDKVFQGSRRKITLAEERGGVCERCFNDNFAILHVHHRQYRSEGGSDDIANLELVCPNCHSIEHSGFMTYEEYKKNNIPVNSSMVHEPAC